LAVKSYLFDILNKINKQQVFEHIAVNVSKKDINNKLKGFLIDMVYIFSWTDERFGKGEKATEHDKTSHMFCVFFFVN
jgi:hypothetical protein